MVFIRYFFKRFFSYFFALLFFITLLLTLVEFFEKLLYASHADFSVVIRFLFLNSIPTLFENFAVSSWLATLFVIREFLQDNQWHTIQILGIRSRVMVRLFVSVGILLMIILFIGKEVIFSHYYTTVRAFKQKHFKQASPNHLYNSWCALDTNRFCFIEQIDLTSGEGKNFMLITCSENAKLVTTLIAEHLYLLGDTRKTVSLSDTQRVTHNPYRHEHNNHLSLTLPKLYAQLARKEQGDTLRVLFTRLILDRLLIPRSLWFDLLNQMIERISWYSHVALYPVITFLLFSFFFTSPHVAWATSIGIYPVATIFITLSSALSRIIPIPGIFLLPYLVLLLGIFLLNQQLLRRKQFVID